MRILITGAAGLLGRDVLEAAAAAGHDAVGLVRAELDISDPRAVVAAVAAACPDVVVNCAAWTDVDGAETRSEAALEANGHGAGHVAAAAAAAGAWTIHVSTDYVFNGRKRAPYVESDAVDPISAYGRSKLRGEQEVARSAPDRHLIVRTSWLFGAHGRCFPRTMLRLAGERDRIDVVADQVGCPTFTGHLASALVGLAASPRSGVLHVAACDHCSWFELATAVVAASGRTCEVRPITTDQYPAVARRPANSVLASERGAPELPGWRAGLTEFMARAAGVNA